MKKAKILAAFCSAAVLTGTIHFHASALAVLDPEIMPLAQILQTLSEDENGILYRSVYEDGIFHYFNTDEEFLAYQLTSETYEIYLENDASLPEDAISQLEAISAFTQSMAYALSQDDAPTISISTEKHDETESSWFELIETEPNTYQLSFSPNRYFIDRSALLSYLQTIPGFCSVSYNVIGYCLNDVGIGYNLILNYSSENEKILWVLVDKGTELKTEDFAEDLFVTNVSPNINEYAAAAGYDEFANLDGDVYAISFDFPSLGVPEGEIVSYSTYLSILDKVQNMEQIQQAGIINNAYFMSSKPTDAIEDYLINNGSISLFTRGDCDNDAKITINDAYLALLEYASVSAGLDSTLTGLARIAANVDGSDKIEITDAYYILLYYSYQSAGLKPQWSELLTESEEDTPSVATGTTELTEDAQ